MKNIFIIILNWNQPKLTIECLESVGKLESKYYKLNIIVVDNASTDNSVEIIEKYISDDSGIEIIVNKENLGFAGGNNVGIRYALNQSAEYIMVLNNDTLVGENLIDGLLNSFKNNPRAGVISPKIYFAKGFEFHKKRYSQDQLGKVIWYTGGNIDWRNIYGSNRGVDEVDHGQYEVEEEVDFATGTCSIFSSIALKQAGLYDERYFMYFEDADLSMRLKRSGFKVLYTPKAHLWHKVAQSSGIGSSLNDYYITRNRMLFAMKYATFRTKLALVKESLKLLFWGRKWQKFGVRDYYLRRFMIGTYK